MKAIMKESTNFLLHMWYTYIWEIQTDDLTWPDWPWQYIYEFNDLQQKDYDQQMQIFELREEKVDVFASRAGHFY